MCREGPRREVNRRLLEGEVVGWGERGREVMLELWREGDLRDEEGGRFKG